MAGAVQLVAHSQCVLPTFLGKRRALSLGPALAGPANQIKGHHGGTLPPAGLAFFHRPTAFSAASAFSFALRLDHRAFRSC